jgi:alkylated DNA repair protein (DNA oxidative demethylase)
VQTLQAASIAPYGPGARLLRGLLSLDVQRALVARSLELANGSVAAFAPIVRGGGKMRLRMLCLGRHWNAQSYRYEDVRGDFDGAPAPPLPEQFRRIAAEAAAAAGYAFDPDICLINLYDADGRLGLHQDKDERAETIAAGAPIVSVSLGAAAQFLLGGLRRRDPLETIRLESGDVFVMGGPDRLRYHGVRRILPGTAPPALGLEGRINLTFRRY